MIIFREKFEYQIGNVALNTLVSYEDDIFSVKEKIVPINDATYTKISKNCFITTDKGRGNIITYKINEVVIDIFFDISVGKNTV